MRTFLILFSAAILIVFVQAQQKPKPVVNLAKRPRPIWNRPPEERRKLSIFPKKDMKFVVTPKILKNDDEAKEGLPTKRPLMRKFVMQDKNERGTWSFAPREPLMKTQRFTVTLAPPKSNHHETSDEIPEESKKVQTVIRNMTQLEHVNKAHNINKGNLIEMVIINKNPSETKTSHKTEQNPTGEEILILQTAKVNDTQDNQAVPKSGDKSLAIFDVDLIDVRSFNDDGVTLDSNVTVNKGENKNTSINKTTDTFSSEFAKDFIESRALDSNEMKYPIDQSNKNSLVPNSEGGNNSLNFDDLEILLEKIVNNTEESNNRSLSGMVDNNDSIKANNETSVPIEDIPYFIHITDQNEDRTFLDLHNGSVVQDLNNSENEKMQPVRESNALNGEGNFTEPADVTFISNLESLFNFMDNDTFSKQNITDTRDSVGSSQQENKDNTARHITASLTHGKLSNYFANDTEDVLQTQSPKTYKNNDTEDSSSHDLSLEIYESDMPLSNEEISTECDECDLTLDEISNKPISNLSNEAEERSNESLMNEPNTLTNEEGNESSSNMTNEETSNESHTDTYSSSNEESIGESSNSFTGEQFSNESFSNMAGEEISNEYYPDKSNNLTEEISNESTVESSQNFTGEQFSNESSSNVADDEFTEEILSESGVDSSDKNISNEFTIISKEDISNESYLTHDISEESLEASYNVTGEVISNDSSSNMSDEESSNEFRLRENVLEENVESFSNFTNEEIPLELIENSGNINDERIPEEFASNLQEANIEIIAEQALINRFKRSNNVIEEEIVPTTVCGFKYSEHEDRLNHDLSYKNINA